MHLPKTGGFVYDKRRSRKMAESKWYETQTAEEIVAFQLYEERLCMPFPLFHKAVEEALGRPVYTHEFAGVESLRQEFEALRKKN